MLLQVQPFPTGLVGLTNLRALTVTFNDNSSTAVELPAAATFPGAGGSLSAAVTKIEPNDLPVAATFPGAGGTSLSAAVTLVPAPVLLVLSDLNTTGLEVVASALIEASGPGTTGGTPYADSSNGGSDTPLDGELGLGPDNTVISLIRRQGAFLRLNDRDNPAAFAIDDYFETGGAGNDLTVSLQTAADGLATFTVADQLSGARNANTVRFGITLGGDVETLLDNLATGDRFIIAFTRLATVELPVAATFPGSGGSLAAAVTKIAPSSLGVAAAFPGAGGSVSAAVTKIAASVLPVAASLPWRGRYGECSAHKDCTERATSGGGLPRSGRQCYRSRHEGGDGSAPSSSNVFPGAGGTLAASVTKVAAEVRPVAAAFPGVGGTLSAAVTKLATGALPVAAVFPGAGGSLAVAVVKIETVTHTVAATFPGIGGALSAAVTLAVPPLALSDFDTTGLEVDASALIEASGPGTSGNNLYADSDRGGTDTPLGGELGLGADDTVISRIRRIDGNTLQLNDDNNPSAFDIGAYFATGGAGNDLTVSLQTAAGGLVTFTAASQVETGGNAVRVQASRCLPTLRRCWTTLQRATALFSPSLGG